MGDGKLLLYNFATLSQQSASGRSSTDRVGSPVSARSRSAIRYYQYWFQIIRVLYHRELRWIGRSGIRDARGECDRLYVSESGFRHSTLLARTLIRMFRCQQTNHGRRSNLCGLCRRKPHR